MFEFKVECYLNVNDAETIYGFIRLSEEVSGGRLDVVDAPMKLDNEAETRQKARSINWIEC